MQKKIYTLLVLGLSLLGCAGKTPMLETVDNVDLDRFMGDWYVIANIPTFLEKGAHNAIETYALKDDGTIQTTFVYRKGSPTGKKKRYEPKAFVRENTGNAVWGMQFIWPIKADYRIVFLNDDYTQTVIARNKLDYVWIMARTPEISEEDYQTLVTMIGSLGYDTDKIKKVPQQWN